MRHFAAGLMIAGMLFNNAATKANPPDAPTPESDYTTSAHHQQRIGEHHERIKQTLLEKQRRQGHTTGMPELKMPQITTRPLTNEERINEHQERIKQILIESQQRKQQTTAMPELKMPRSHKQLTTPTNEAIANEELQRTSRIIDDANQRRQQKVALTSATAAETMDQLDDQLDTALKQINRPCTAPLNLAGTESASHKRGPISTKQALADAMGLTSLKTTDRFEVIVPPGGEINVTTPQGIMKSVSASPDTTLVIRMKDAE